MGSTETTTRHHPVTGCMMVDVRRTDLGDKSDFLSSKNIPSYHPKYYKIMRKLV